VILPIMPTIDINIQSLRVAGSAPMSTKGASTTVFLTFKERPHWKHSFCCGEETACSTVRSYDRTCDWLADVSQCSSTSQICIMYCPNYQQLAINFQHPEIRSSHQEEHPEALYEFSRERSRVATLVPRLKSFSACYKTGSATSSTQAARHERDSYLKHTTPSKVPKSSHPTTKPHQAPG
jgi:hypothetical protein